MVGIYKYTNKLNGKVYIGRSINITHRKWEHVNHPSLHSIFDQLISKIGEDKFDFEIIEECLPEELQEKEKYWIKYYDCCILDGRDKGYNMTRGGEEYASENNVWAKLTEKEVIEIIDKLQHTKTSMYDLAKEYNVHYNSISNINRCKTWTWLHNFKNNIRIESQGRVKGGEFGTNKITEKQALYIINLLEHDNRSMNRIAKEENFSYDIVIDINRCRTWKYLHNYKSNIRKEYKERYNQGGDANYEDSTDN